MTSRTTSFHSSEQNTVNRPDDGDFQGFHLSIDEKGQPEVFEDEASSSTTSSRSTDEQHSRPTSVAITTLTAAIIIGFVSGTLYAFGRYNRALKEVLGLSQLQVQQLGIWLDCGSAFGHPIVGWIYDHYGPKVSCLLAAMIVSSSYFWIHSSVQGSSVSSMFLLQFAFGGVGFGSGLGYIAGLGSTTKQFLNHPKYTSRAIGLVAAGYGLSGTFVGISYQMLGLDRFFLFWAIAVAVVNVGASMLLQNKRKTTRTENNHSTQTTPLVPEGEQQELHQAGSVVEVESAPRNDDAPWESWKTVEFWLLFFAFACVTGCGLFVINNLSTMVQSIGEPDSYAGTLIITLSISNAIGRMVMGTLGDYAIQRNKLFLFQMDCVGMATILFLASVFGQHLVFLVILVICVAMAYGGSFVVVVAILTTLFGKAHFGKDYGLLGMAPALSGLTFNTLSAWLYEQHSEDNVCVGPQCYRTAYLLTGSAACVGFLLLRALIAHHSSSNQPQVGSDH